MHPKGHLGSMLLAYTPFAFLLTYTEHYIFVVIGFVALTSATMLPDIDMKLWFVKHRGFTHTVWFGLIMGIFLTTLLTGALYYAEMIPPITLWEVKIILFMFFIGNMMVLGHLLGDIITVMGLRPFRPVSDRKVRIESKYLPLPTKAASKRANAALLLLGWLALLLSIGSALYLSYLY